MNIAFVTLGFNPVRTSGLDISGERLVRGLLERGNQVTVIATGNPALTEMEMHPNLKVIRITPNPTNWIGYSLQAAYQLRKIEKFQSFDIKHFWDVHFAYGYREPYIASLQHSFQQRINTRRISIQRWIYYQTARYFAERPSVERAKGLIAGSRTTLSQFRKEYKLQSHQIAIARHGIDTAKYQPGIDASLLRDKLGIANNEPVVMFAGFITPRKGIDYLATVLPSIHPKPRLILVGKMDSTYRSEFNRLVGSAREQVIEVGFVADEDMPKYYSLADIYVSTSLLEGFGLPIIESLACGTPVVAFRGGSVAEIIGPGGKLTEPGDTAAIADEISELLSDPYQRKALGSQGRQYVLENFTVDMMVDGMLDAYTRFSGE